MSYGENTTMLVEPYNGNNCNNGGFGWGGDWSAWIILFLIFGMFGWGGYGFGGGFGGGAQGYGVDAAVQRGFDNQTVINKLNGLENGLCDGFYAVNNSFGTLTNNMNQGFNGLNTAIVSQGYESRLATQGVQAQLSDCCCENEKIAMQSRFDAAQSTCATLQAIDKVGDRIIDYLAADKAQTLRDENQALRLAASQQAQNNYLINQLRPCPVPAYVTCNPWAASYGIGLNNGGCGCGNYGNIA